MLWCCADPLIIIKVLEFHGISKEEVRLDRLYRALLRGPGGAGLGCQGTCELESCHGAQARQPLASLVQYDQVEGWGGQLGGQLGGQRGGQRGGLRTIKEQAARGLLCQAAYRRAGAARLHCVVVAPLSSARGHHQLCVPPCD